MPGFADWWAALRWWAALALLGAAALPLVYTIFGRLNDRGYAFARLLGLLLVAYLFWLLGSLGFLYNNVGSVLLSTGAVAAFSLFLYRRSDRQLGTWLRARRRHIALTELLFAAVFVIWVIIRAQDPSIRATEKPMEFAFLNAVGRSPAFPPLDPWLSGFSISYYYFGYVMSSVIARLSGVAEPVAFNLSIAWLAAATALGAFGLVYNIVAAGGPRLARRARALALVAALAIPMAGHLEIVAELAYGAGLGAGTTVAVDDADQPLNFWQWLDVPEINNANPPPTPRYSGSGWWWFRASRVIHEYDLDGSRAGIQPIAEFPGFSFILGDLHPHVMALPYAFLTLAFAFVWWQRPAAIPIQAWQRGGPVDGPLLLLRRLGWPLLSLTMIVLGGLSFLNTWDVFIHLFVILGAYVLANWRDHGRWHNAYLSQALLLAMLLVLPAILLYLPFYLGFRSQAGPPFLLPTLVQPTRLPQFLLIFGLPLLSIIPLLFTLVARRNWRLVLGTAVALFGGLTFLMFLLGWLVAASPDGVARVSGIASSLGQTLPPLPPDTPLLAHAAWALGAVGNLAGPLLVARLSNPWVTLLLLLVAGAAVAAAAGRLEAPPATDLPPNRVPAPPAPPASALPFVLLLILTGALLTLGPEFVYLRDNFGARMNTIFKFYYQAWVMFGVAAVVALDILWRRARLVAIPVSGLGGLLLALTFLYPALAASSRAGDYRALVGAAEGESVATLDGLAFLSAAARDEYLAVQWLRDNVAGTPVILEAVDGQYTEGGRIAARTGLPTLLGWAGHEYQWRGFSTPEPAEREPVVRQIYENQDWTAVAPLLDQYDVEYIVVGTQELSQFGPGVREKFDRRLEPAFRTDGVTIYRWLPR